MPESALDTASLRAIVFDLDGTLYRQDTLRRAMLLRLLRGYATRPLSGLRTFKALGAYRRAQEQLRESANQAAPSSDLAADQLRFACQNSGADPAFVAGCVARWMEREPLALLAHHIQPGLLEFLGACKTRGLRLGVLSDYPAIAKLQALRLESFFDIVLNAQSAEVGAFKPHPRGLLLAIEQLGVRPAECVYVGDRVEVDATVAVAAGVPSVILSKQIGFAQLHVLLLGQPQADRSSFSSTEPPPSLNRRYRLR